MGKLFNISLAAFAATGYVLTTVTGSDGSPLGTGVLTGDVVGRSCLDTMLVS